MNGSANQVKQEGTLEKNTSRLRNHKENLSSLTLRISRIAGELLGPIPQGEPPEMARDTSPGLMGLLSSVLDDTEKVTRELGEVIDRMETLA